MSTLYYDYGPPVSIAQGVGVSYTVPINRVVDIAIGLRASHSFGSYFVGTPSYGASYALSMSDSFELTAIAGTVFSFSIVNNSYYILVTVNGSSSFYFRISYITSAPISGMVSAYQFSFYAEEYLIPTGR